MAIPGLKAEIEILKFLFVCGWMVTFFYLYIHYISTNIYKLELAQHDS